MADAALDQRYERIDRWRSWLVASQRYEAIGPRLRAGALLRWCMVALVAFVAVTSPPQPAALAVGWLALVSLYNALGQYGSDVLTGRPALRLAQGLVAADLAAIVCLTAMYRGLPPAGLTMGFLLVLLEALLWCDRRGVILSIGLIAAGWTAADLVARVGSTRVFPWTACLGDLLTLAVVAIALVLALRVLAATANGSSAHDDAGTPSADGAVRIRLSAREKEVLALVSAGCSNRMIAARLHLATSTVKSHIESILERLGARNRAEAVAIAARLRLLSDAAPDSTDGGEAALGDRSQTIRVARPVNLTGSLSRRF
ncbi:MAG TPA: helix-turn-helix transcriptional regulator [Candidatus Dormibacteraeota bacterium]|nr:helix-turn-helix transcriptional regulator [Candidatus Dormibacteraeota bacterium]